MIEPRNLERNFDYLAIGHVTCDLVNGTYAVGGTVSYAARTARALGCRVGIVTSASPDLDLNDTLGDIMVARIPAATTTTFENIYTPAGRRQILHATAERLVPDMVPQDWRTTSAGTIVHLGPVAQECDPALADVFGDRPSGAFIGLTPQGWMRRRDQAGHVSRCHWDGAESLLARADAVVLSEEDIAGDEILVSRYAAQTRLLVLTQGAAGCTVYTEGQSRHFSAPAAREVDATGSGDIFAATFFVQLQRDLDPWAAARFANCVAAQSVARAGLDGTPTPEEAEHCRKKLVTRDS
ncbi:MAG: PfkB family carbohydrate kinase [Anaerolineae bacterium]|jgi:sugar/nucleoside kinase (ribokinase family)